MPEKFFENLADMPLIAILRGVQPENAVEVAETLLTHGFRIVEVPLNSPDPFTSIQRIATRLGSELTVGAGTVLTVKDAERVAAAGGEIAVSPNVDAAVVRRIRELGLEPIPGVATPTEALAALQAGASVLKVFPADSLGSGFFGHLGAVLPQDHRLLAVGGVDLGNLPRFLEAGAAGAGLGSSLFRPGMDMQSLAGNAAGFTDLIRTSRA